MNVKKSREEKPLYERRIWIVSEKSEDWKNIF